MTTLKCSNEDCPYGGEIKDRRGWHVDKGLNIGHLLLSLTMLAGFFVFAMAQEKRITTLENAVKVEHEVNLAQDAERNRQRDELRQELKSINEKLDRMAERRR